MAADSGGKRASPRGLPARQRPRGPGLSAGLSRGDRAGRSPKEERGRLLPSLAGCSGTCWISGRQCRHPEAELTQEAAGSLRPPRCGQEN